MEEKKNTYDKNAGMEEELRRLTTQNILCKHEN